jgi:hypothetical protein
LFVLAHVPAASAVIVAVQYGNSSNNNVADWERRLNGVVQGCSGIPEVQWAAAAHPAPA